MGCEVTGRDLGLDGIDFREQQLSRYYYKRITLLIYIKLTYITMFNMFYNLRLI